MKVVSTQMAFVGGRRYRPGEVFEIPDGAKLGEGMRKAGEPGPKPPEMGDTKPADARAAAKRKAAGGDAS